jgi:hypothetical protein
MVSLRGLEDTGTVKRGKPENSKKKKIKNQTK